MKSFVEVGLGFAVLVGVLDLGAILVFVPMDVLENFQEDEILQVI